MKEKFVNVKCVGIENIKEIANGKSIVIETKSTGRLSLEVNFRIKESAEKIDTSYSCTKLKKSIFKNQNAQIYILRKQQ